MFSKDIGISAVDNYFWYIYFKSHQWTSSHDELDMITDNLDLFIFSGAN